MSRRSGLGRVGRGSRLKVVLLALTVLMGPTVGDIGSCGQELLELDAVKFFTEKAFIDCLQCNECGLTSNACERACAQELEQEAFPENCFPLVHDGEVCLNALQAAGCNDYRSYTDDNAPTIPTECSPSARTPGSMPKPTAATNTIPMMSSGTARSALRMVRATL